MLRSVSRLSPLAIALAAVPTVMITARAKRALLALIIRLTHSIIWRPLRRIVVGIRQGTHWLVCRRVQQHLHLQLLPVPRAGHPRHQRAKSAVSLVKGVWLQRSQGRSNPRENLPHLLRRILLPMAPAALFARRPSLAARPERYLSSSKVDLQKKQQAAAAEKRSVSAASVIGRTCGSTTARASGGAQSVTMATRTANGARRYSATTSFEQ